MPKVISRGKVKVDVSGGLDKPKYKEIDLKDYDDGFYGHLTHESMQKNEDSVKCMGDGFSDSSVPKKPVTDKFYVNVHRSK